MHLVHGMGPKIMKRDNSGHNGSECGRNSRIADIANVLLTFDVEIVNFRLQGSAYLGGGAGEIDEHAAGVDYVHAKAVGLKPSCDCIEVRLCQTEPFAKFLRGQPVLQVCRTLR